MIVFQKQDWRHTNLLLLEIYVTNSIPKFMYWYTTLLKRNEDIGAMDIWYYYLIALVSPYVFL